MMIMEYSASFKSLLHFPPIPPLRRRLLRLPPLPHLLYTFLPVLLISSSTTSYLLHSVLLTLALFDGLGFGRHI